LSNASIQAVCVTFKPDLERLRSTIAAAIPQVTRLLVVDNSECAQMGKQVREAATTAGAEYRWLRGNLGLAGAFNEGIQDALQGDCTHILLLDQDSIPASDMVAQLLAAETEQAQADKLPIAALGPHYADPRAGRSTTYVRFSRFPPQRIDPDAQPAVFAVDMLISSGTLIPRPALELIGLMDAGLFIDHVDTDWCLRAAHAGHRLLVVQKATMDHQLGTRWVRLGSRSLPLHDVERMYYVFRNSLLLYKREYAHWRWILADIRRLLVVLVLHLSVGERRFVALCRMLRGLLDASSNTTGKRL
jgi:rhamnosyltransferase